MGILGIPRNAVGRAALGCALLGFSVLCWRTAWLSDDAVISLRTVDNFLHGYGLRWNVDERVETFTHPLWLLCLTLAHACTGEPFFSTLYLSWIVSTLAAALLLFACPGAVLDKLLALIVLAFSQSFVDFSSGGLENPLTHWLIVVFVTVYERESSEPRVRSVWLSIIAGCAALNRMDSAVLFVPALAYVMWNARREVPLHYYLVGALPLLGWELFSVLYYGFPFPNTAYAKLSQDEGNALLRWWKGWNYIRHSWSNDPITLAALLSCAGLCFARADRARAPLLLGALGYLLYAVSVGGDFMTGRFLSAPLCMGIACLASSHWFESPREYFGAAVLVAVLASLGRFAPPFTGADFAMAPGQPEVDEFGLHNERRMFFDVSSLLHAERLNDANHRWAGVGRKYKSEAAQDAAKRVRVVDAIGYAGYYAGPGVHLVDRWALADALIARLPAISGQYGHYPRVIPVGYEETLRSHENRIADPALATYYRDLSLVITGPLWSADRLRAIWRLNSGQDQELLEEYAFVRSSRLHVNFQVRNPGASSTVIAYVWNAKRTTGYTLDSASSPGEIYDLEWDISAHAARLLEPADATQTAALADLAPKGMIAVAVGFADQVGQPLREIHELRFRYHLDGERIELQRQPEPVWNASFPKGAWHAGRAPGVLGLESTSAAQ